MGNVIKNLGGRITSIVITELMNDTFYAKLIISVDNAEQEIDSRPSDALALAVRSEVPIYADDSVLDKAGILLDKETGKPLTTEDDDVPLEKLSDDEMKRKMGGFYDFINTLDLDDFDKRKS